MADDLPTLRLRLADAQLAKHKLLTGQMRVRLMHVGGSTTASADFAKPDLPQLEAYIRELLDRIAALTGEVRTGHRAFSLLG